MSRVLLVLLGVALGVVATLSFLARERTAQPVTVVVPNTPRVAPHDDADAAQAGAVEAAADARVRLDAAALSLVDVASVAVQATDLSPETLVPGRVADRGALLGALRELAAARAAAAAQREVGAAQRARLERLRALAREGEIAVSRELAALELASRREAEQGLARRAEVERLGLSLRTHWGVLAEDEDLAAALSAPAAQLVEFAAAELPATTVFVAAGDERAAAQEARVLGAAPGALGATAAATWFALARAPELRVGMRVSVWIPRATPAARGTLLPAAAVVWHGGAQWYYVERAPGDYQRHRLHDGTRHDLGVILEHGLAPGTRVVTRGAQALLAEELRSRIPDEDDD